MIKFQLNFYSQNYLISITVTNLKKKINTNYRDNEMMRWYSDVFPNLELAEKIFLDIKTKLKTIPHPYCGWRSAPNQEYETISINKFGLRSPNMDIDNSKKEYCILLGGSVAWGFGASKNEYTPSYQIEKYLKKNNMNLEVINLAQNSMNSHDELRSFISSVDEIKPKMVISISGINDLWQLGKKNFNKCHDLLEEPINFFQWGQTMGIPKEKNPYKKLIKIFLRYLKKTNYQNRDYVIFKKFENVPEEIFQHKVEVMQSFCEYKKIKMIHVLQPNIFFKKTLSKSEKKYQDFWIKNSATSFSEQKIKNFFESLRIKFFRKENYTDNSIFIDASNFFDEYENSIFFDLSHNSDKGYEMMSKKIVQNIIKHFK